MGNTIGVEDDFGFDSSCSYAFVIVRKIITPLTETVVFLPGAFVKTVVCDTQAVVDLQRSFVPTVVCDFVDLRRTNRVGNTIDVVGSRIDVEDDFGFDSSSNCSFACVVIIKIITPFVCTGSCVTGTVLPIVGLQIIGFETTGTLTVGVQIILCVVGLCAGSCVPGTVKNGVLYATIRFVNEFLSDDIVVVAPFAVKLPRCNFSPLGSSIVSISASCV